MDGGRWAGGDDGARCDDGVVARRAGGACEDIAGAVRDGDDLPRPRREGRFAANHRLKYAGRALPQLQLLYKHV